LIKVSGLNNLVNLSAVILTGHAQNSLHVVTTMLLAWRFCRKWHVLNAHT